MVTEEGTNEAAKPEHPHADTAKKSEVFRAGSESKHDLENLRKRFTHLHEKGWLGKTPEENDANFAACIKANDEALALCDALMQG